eukprot:scaffold68468_cov36-Tisochrysis_lutea.AAC.1
MHDAHVRVLGSSVGLVMRTPNGAITVHAISSVEPGSTATRCLIPQCVRVVAAHFLLSPPPQRHCPPLVYTLILRSSVLRCVQVQA